MTWKSNNMLKKWLPSYQMGPLTPSFSPFPYTRFHCSSFAMLKHFGIERRRHFPRSHFAASLRNRIELLFHTVQKGESIHSQISFLSANWIYSFLGSSIFNTLEKKDFFTCQQQHFEFQNFDCCFSRDWFFSNLGNPGKNQRIMNPLHDTNWSVPKK